jgi:hypothetical protein
VCSFYDANMAHKIRSSSMYFLYTILSITSTKKKHPTNILSVNGSLPSIFFQSLGKEKHSAN